MRRASLARDVPEQAADDACVSLHPRGVRALSALVWNVFAVLRAPFFFVRRALAARRVRWVRVRLRARIVALPRPRPFWTRWVPGAAQAEVSALPALLELCDALEDDRRVEGVLLEIPLTSAGWAVLRDLREALGRVRRRGKRLVAYLPEGGGHRELYLASACDVVLVGRHATLSLPGLASVRRYAQPLLEKLGVSLEVHRRAEFKTAVEGLTEPHMTEPQRAQVQALIDGIEAELVHALAERPGLDEAGARALLSRAMFTAEEAVGLGLIDAVVHDDEVRAALLPASGSTQAGPRAVAPTPIEAAAYVALTRARLFRPVVAPNVTAILPVLGAIGESSAPGGASRAQLVPTVRGLARDPRVAAVVLYVDSPGGSALASERIHREVELLAQKKPVIACFGDVAASGGYYVAAPAHAIVARPQTLTGSIGVVSARLVASSALEAIGLRTEVVKNAPSADYFAHPRAGTEQEHAMTERSIQAFYDRFLEIVGRGRKMTREAVDALARGRVWTGTDAHVHGLIDTLGGLPEALELARSRAGLPKLEPVIVWSREGEVPPLDAPAEGSAAWVGSALESLAAGIDPDLAALARLAASPGEQVLAYAVDLPRLR